ncbi:MAG TPA: hypothetical protein DCP71_16775 [Verrucomicrobiales bacterium]|nr:hypothetical protein [Verrucomicrobiales bacterium]
MSGCSFDEYAAFLIRRQGIQPGDSLVGVSLGGMLACEISKQVHIAKLTLISSCTQRQHLHPLLSRLAFLGPFVPWGLRWACSCAADWSGLEGHEDVVSIHGDRDPVFPIHRQRVHHTIVGGDHLMVISRQAEILPLLMARHGDED